MPMKPIRINQTPTRNRPLNLLLGAVMLLAAALLLLSLATYHPADPSLNTSTAGVGPKLVQNWIGPAGAYLSDVLLQALGLAAFCLPLWLGGLGWRWISLRGDRPAWMRWIGVILTLAFLPAALGLLPWHWRWLHALPIEGVTGRLVADLLTANLNLTGAAIVAGVLAAAGLYLGSSFSFRAAWEWAQERSIQLSAWHDRYSNWQADLADRRAEERAVREAELGPDGHLEFSDEEDAPKRGLLARMFGRMGKRKLSVEEELDEIPAVQRVGRRAVAQEEAAPLRPKLRPSDVGPSIWERRDAVPERPARRPAARVEVEHVEDELDPIEAVPISSRVVEPVRDPWANDAPVSARSKAREAVENSTDFAAPLRPVPVPAAAPLREGASAPPAASRLEKQLASVTVHERADADLRTTTVAPKNVSGFKLPPSTLLTQGEEPLAIREDMLREEARKLVEKCGEFKVNGQVVQINPGPMVTTYEFKPDASVKYSRVAGLGDDLCLAMRAESILIERMAGKSTIGIQVPNHERETIHLRDVIESETFAKAKSRLTLAMGKDINGRIVTADLAGMPHVLIAGSTGSGKSVAINAMIMSLLFRTTPAQVRLILVDPKRVELGMYEGIPHLFTPIITEAKLAANALRNAVREMERRLKLLASRSVRNIDQYNTKLSEQGMASLFTDAGEEETPLPYIVIIIDELADLMMLDRSNVEESITRLAQMARAVGIHLILATQRPSVDVITGLIKANVPTRISFRLASKVDSRTIIDDNGAESLLGRGDMLFRPPGTSRLMRLHAPYVSEKETAAVVDFWKAQGEAEYVEGFLEAPREERKEMEGDGSAEGDDDELFDDAVRLVFEFGKASTSLLQRRLRVGYGRAAHLIDLMERDGLVGPADGSRPRELLKHPGWLHEVPSAIE